MISEHVEFQLGVTLGGEENEEQSVTKHNSSKKKKKSCKFLVGF